MIQRQKYMQLYIMNCMARKVDTAEDIEDEKEVVAHVYLSWSLQCIRQE